MHRLARLDAPGILHHIKLSVAKYSETIKTEIILLIVYQIFCLQHKAPVMPGSLSRTTHIFYSEAAAKYQS
jgi:hypothetical protein